MNIELPKVNANKEKVLLNKKDLESKVKIFSAVVYFRLSMCYNSHYQKTKIGKVR